MFRSAVSILWEIYCEMDSWYWLIILNNLPPQWVDVRNEYEQ